MTGNELIALAKAIAATNGHPAPAEWAEAVQANYHVAPDEPPAPPAQPEGST